MDFNSGNRAARFAAGPALAQAPLALSAFFLLAPLQRKRSACVAKLVWAEAAHRV